jgi:hypothetical protein
LSLWVEDDRANDGFLGPLLLSAVFVSLFIDEEAFMPTGAENTDFAELSSMQALIIILSIIKIGNDEKF